LSGASLDRAQQLVEWFDKQSDSVREHMAGHLLQADADLFKPSEHCALFIEIIFDRNSSATVIPKRDDRRRRKCVDRFSADERLNIIDIWIDWILCRSRGPQWSLKLCAFL